MADEAKKEDKEVFRGGNKDFPLIKIERAIEVTQEVAKIRPSASLKDLEIALKVKGGGLSGLVAYTKRYGLITGRGNVVITELGKKILYPSKENEELEGKREAFLNVPMFKELLEQYKDQEFPADDIFKNILIRRYSANERDAVRLINIIKDARNKLFGGHEQVVDEDRKSDNQRANLGAGGRRTFTSDQFAGKNQVDAALYSLVKNIGFLEALSKCPLTSENKDEVRKRIDEIFAKSKDFKSINLTANMTLKELAAGAITEELCLKRVPFFDEALKSDLGIQEPGESQEQTNANQTP